MKKLLYLFLFSLLIYSCKKDMNIANFSGKIVHQNSDSLVISNPDLNFSQTIKIDKDGTFTSDLTIENGLFSISDGTEYTLIYLEKGDDLKVNIDAKNFLNAIRFSGDRAKENNFLATSVINEEGLLSDTGLMNLPKADFDTKIKAYVQEFNNRLKNDILSSDFIVSQQLEINDLKKYYEDQYLEKNYFTLKLGKGVPSPKFVNYENYNGETTSLDDLKGKYVYIDLWATWCPPCKYEIPYLQKVEEEFHGKNIVFVSISLDNSKDHDTWRKMVSDKKLGGIQLYAKEDKQFPTAYKVASIPRFILIDTEGKIIDANAPKPSKPALVELLNTLDL